MATVLNASEPADASTTDSIQYMRLHVTPLDKSLLSVVVPSSVLPCARNISYHTIEAFPEKRYGFVDLPLADADKIKKKLNGAILRGIKMRVEKARPEAIPQPTGDAATDVKKEKKKCKKRKREADVTPGIELEGRKVKRGWTTTEREMVEEKRKKAKREKECKDDKKDKKKKKHVKSKYIDGPECLFKTKLPDASSSSQTTEDAGEHKKRKGSREVVVHEFEKTVKHPSFLKSTVEKSSSNAVIFEDGVGWVDETGIIVEPVVSKRPKDHSSKPKSARLQSAKPTPVTKDDTSSSDYSSSESSDDEVSDEESDSSNEKAGAVAPPEKLRVETLASSSSMSITKTESARPKSSSSITSLAIKIPPATPAAMKVHPLEALYKRPKGNSPTTGAPQEVHPFSFFGGGEEDVEEEDAAGPSSQPPMTPFTKQDFEFRNTRSAAPTPDTAHPNSRTFNLWPRNNSVEEEDEEEEDGGDNQDDDDDNAIAGMSNEAAVADDGGQTAVSDFQKQFWEGRGGLNRSWRKRRKAASKEKRYRENRARAERAI
ncbi:hypothetical protein GGR53DRAFT_226518 [Hypoxylon sp. FL1150]|nr:hypothetical protein GGR53DRAFT_226518 [Hypoxylon sp. FL1150]